MELLKSKEQLFWRNVTLISDFPEDCWLWNKSTNSGYGELALYTPYQGKQIRIRAHRYSYLMFVGPIPEDRLCLHSCDQRGCCNPLHLFLGTHKDNTDDMYLKHREEVVHKISQGMLNYYRR